ncbi:DUF4229 domain-containing protein [Paenibacillus sp. TRM 82003]|uniref:DUF4229 domain-containing protein n=1 Tax=Kineococcus sp. TRM81007 TaxID=2925831 RepID=UPI001F5AA1E7|nr:DUF4229 domain-containing protein [Kineococcus sp. TRM81007]MCI2238860.1 DUF4229 domain-containing protein [Kineococcus sp. TRM81007]MCI3924265.1 DUF4229 domain-containing protein [Paenibacillus sp. TRM 82003]
MGATLKYTVLRLGIFVLCLLLMSALGARGWLALAVAAVLSVLLSLLLLRRQREEMAARLQQRVEGRLQGGQGGATSARATSRFEKSRFAKGVQDDNAAEDDGR